MPPPRSRVRRRLTALLLALAVPSSALAATLTIDDPLISTAECADLNDFGSSRSWDLSSAGWEWSLGLTFAL